jgi:hypothetical protein
MSSNMLTISTYSYMLVVIIYNGILIIMAYNYKFADIANYSAIVM